MKKIFLVILGIIVTIFLILLFVGPSDPIILTEEDASRQYEEYNNRFTNNDIEGFETTDINGEKVSSEIFNHYNVTMINIFTTWCSPCIAEMPEIGKLYYELPGKSNIIGICVDDGDDYDTLELAKEIMINAKADFHVLIPDQILNDKFLDKVTMYPTTIFVNNNGEIIGNVYNGSRSKEDYKAEINKILNMIGE